VAGSHAEFPHRHFGRLERELKAFLADPQRMLGIVTLAMLGRFAKRPHHRG
jgi:hypothetical protein